MFAKRAQPYQNQAVNPSLTLLKLLACTMMLGEVSRAQTPGERPPPPPPGSKDGRMFGGFGRGHFGPPGGRDSDFAKLTEEERTQVRKALEEAWKTPEVESARDRLMKANEDFRKAMQSAVEKTDPAAAKILAKIRPPTPWDVVRDRVRLPRPEDPKFVEAAVGRLAMELYNFAKPEHRDAARKLHDRVIEFPSVKSAIEAMRAAEPPKRMEAFKKLAEEYKKQVDAEVASLKKKYGPPPGESPPSKPAP